MTLTPDAVAEAVAAQLSMGRNTALFHATPVAASKAARPGRPHGRQGGRLPPHLKQLRKWLKRASGRSSGSSSSSSEGEEQAPPPPAGSVGGGGHPAKAEAEAEAEAAASPRATAAGEAPQCDQHRRRSGRHGHHHGPHHHHPEWAGHRERPEWAGRAHKWHCSGSDSHGHGHKGPGMLWHILKQLHKRGPFEAF